MTQHNTGFPQAFHGKLSGSPACQECQNRAPSVWALCQKGFILRVDHSIDLQVMSTLDVKLCVLAR